MRRRRNRERLGHQALKVVPRRYDLILERLPRGDASEDGDERNMVVATEKGWYAVSWRIGGRGNNAMAFDGGCRILDITIERQRIPASGESIRKNPLCLLITRPPSARPNTLPPFGSLRTPLPL